MCSRSSESSPGIGGSRINSFSRSRGLKVPVTSDIVDKEKWNAFWDAPLDLSPTTRAGNPPPVEGIAHQPGLPRSPDEIKRATAVFSAERCDVRTDGARLEVAFPGVQMGVFSGRLQFTVYRGTNLIRLETIASTMAPSVAYKYDAGLKGLTIDDRSRVVWRDLSNLRQDYRLGGAPNEAEVPLKASNRLIVGRGGRRIDCRVSSAPYFLLDARDRNQSWVRLVPQGQRRLVLVRRASGGAGRGGAVPGELFALQCAAGQRAADAPVLLRQRGRGSGRARRCARVHAERSLQVLPGYQVMASHFHMDLGQRTRATGSLDNKLPDLLALRAAGINIVSPTDRPNAASRLSILADYYETARRHSDRTSSSCRTRKSARCSAAIGTSCSRSRCSGHAIESPVSRSSKIIPTYGKLYRTGSPEDIMEMVRRENALIFMPHPRTKGSTGFPDAVKDTPHFKDDNYRGVEWRWGMGLDLSERRLRTFACSAARRHEQLDGEYDGRAEVPARHHRNLRQGAGRRYLRQQSGQLHQGRSAADDGGHEPDHRRDQARRLLHDVGRSADSVLYAEGNGDQRTIAAEVEWTFPLEFVEVVWGDGVKTERQVIPATNLAPFGKHVFEIPFNAAGKKWVRFAAWDSAGNGALVQPIKLSEK